MHFLLQIDNVSAIGSMASASSTVTHALPLCQFEYIVYISDILQVFMFFILCFTIFMPANCRSCVYRWPFVDALGCNKHADTTAIIAVINAICVCSIEVKAWANYCTNLGLNLVFPYDFWNSFSDIFCIICCHFRRKK